MNIHWLLNMGNAFRAIYIYNLTSHHTSELIISVRIHIIIMNRFISINLCCEGILFTWFVDFITTLSPAQN